MANKKQINKYYRGKILSIEKKSPLDVKMTTHVTKLYSAVVSRNIRF